MRPRLPGMIILVSVAIALNPLIAWGLLLSHHRFGWPQRSVMGRGSLEATDRAKSLWQAEFGPSVFVDRMEGRYPVTLWPPSHWYGTNHYLLDEGRWKYSGFTSINVHDELRSNGGPKDPREPRIDIVDAGWPMACLTGWRADDGTTRKPPRGEWRVQMKDYFGNRAQVILPVIPRWMGFALNTVIYLLTLLALRMAFVQAKRLRRRQRGKCAHCGYDLRGLRGGVCPECGSLNVRAHAGSDDEGGRPGSVESG